MITWFYMSNILIDVPCHHLDVWIEWVWGMLFPESMPTAWDFIRRKDEKIHTAFILALGGHSAGGGTGIYNYGDYGALNGLMAVWDSWIDNYFSESSNTSSLILLFDERDFHRHTVNTNYVWQVSSYILECLTGLQQVAHTDHPCHDNFTSGPLFLYPF